MTDLTFWKSMTSFHFDRFLRVIVELLLLLLKLCCLRWIYTLLESRELAWRREQILLLICLEQQNCQIQMLPPRKEYFFTFSLNKIDLLTDLELTLETYSHLRIDILASNRLLESSPEVPYLPNEYAEIVLNKLVSFRVGQEKDGGQLRLVMVGEEVGERVVGRYEFQFGNYMRAYEQLRRNCIELSVQITPQLGLIYDVFLERTEQALHRIIREHQAAVRFNFHADVVSEVDSFLPHEITSHNLEEHCREVRIDEASPLLINHRFWSPKRSRFSGLRRLSNLSSASNDQAEGSSSSLTFDGNRVSHLKLNKSTSTLSDLELSKARKPSCAASNIIELDMESQPETEDHQKQLFQLYEVIKSDCKISLPEELKEGIQKAERPQPLEQDAEKEKKLKRSTNKYQSPAKYVLLAVIVITIISFFIFHFEKPSLKFQKNKRAKRAKRTL